MNLTFGEATPIIKPHEMETGGNKCFVKSALSSFAAPNPALSNFPSNEHSVNISMKGA